MRNTNEPSNPGSVIWNLQLITFENMIVYKEVADTLKSKEVLHKNLQFMVRKIKEK